MVAGRTSRQLVCYRALLIEAFHPMFRRLPLLFLFCQLLMACDDGHDVIVVSQNDTPDPPTAQPPDGGEVEPHQDGAVSYSTADTGIWPPQPVGVGNIQPFTNNVVADHPREIKFADVVTIALQDPRVLSAIGSRHELVGTYEAHSKNDKTTQTAMELFNYETNQVVTINIGAANRLSVSTQPAYEYQPAESDNERARAIEIAASHLLALGYRTDHLIGTALLSHPTAAEFEGNGRYFYDQRIIYVTFGYGSGSTPLYRATVNLSRQSVSKAGSL